MANKSKKITPLKLSDDARKELERRKYERGISFVQSVEDALAGKDRFNSIIEAEIEDYRKKRNCSRPDAIEAMLIEAIAARAVNSGQTKPAALDGGAETWAQKLPAGEAFFQAPPQPKGKGDQERRSGRRQKSPRRDAEQIR